MNRTAVLELMLTVGLFLNSMIIFLFLKNKRYGWLDLSALITFVVYWLLLLVFGESFKGKVLASLYLLTIAIMRFVIARKREESS